MNYTLHQLQIFLKIAQTESITKASEELNLTQPAVSIQLKNFQEQFEIPLTETIGRRIHITEFGKKIAQIADNILNEVANINYQTSAFKGLLTGKLKLAIVSTGKYVMPYFLAGFLQKNAKIELKMDVTNRMKVIESLENNEIDFALVSILPENLEVEKLELLENQLFLVGNSKTEIEIAENVEDFFETQPVIFREKGSGTRQTMEKFLQSYHLNIRKKIELTSNEAVKQAILADLGFSIMPLIGIKAELKSGDLKLIPMAGLPIQTTWQLIWLKKKNLSPVAQAFLEYIKTEKENVLKKFFN